MHWLAHLPERGIITVAGNDRAAFLQGLVSNDIAAVAPGHAVWAALLTPQGRWLADFFVFDHDETLKLDCERAQIPMLIQRLSRYRLRMNVALGTDDDARLYVAWGTEPEVGGVVAPDPRLPDFAWRILASPEANSHDRPTASQMSNATAEDWDLYRLAAGLPDGSRDMEPDRTLLLEAGFDELAGVSWSKGCYMGQELTARTKYRGLLKRRLVPVAVDGPLPAPGTPILREGVEVGMMRSGRKQIGLAVLRLDSLRHELQCGDAKLTPRIPHWMRLPALEA
jgi:tRNA-modifying protein YgfZ